MVSLKSSEKANELLTCSNFSSDPIFWEELYVQRGFFSISQFWMIAIRPTELWVVSLSSFSSVESQDKVF